MLPYDENEMWYGHPDLYMKKIDENLNTPDDNDIGFFFEVDFKYHDNIKKQNFFHFVQGISKIILINIKIKRKK